MKASRTYLLAGMAALVALFATTRQVCGHGFAGARFFPATLTTDDPFVADELSLPTFNTIRTSGDGGTREIDFSVDIAKRITPNFGIQIGEGFTSLNSSDGQTVTGFDNLELGAKYQLLENDAHEAIVSVGLDMEVGGTGARSVGSDPFSTWAPAIFFGKGFGDLPDSVRFLKPFALTGQLGVAFPSSASSRTVTIGEASGLRSVDIEQHPDSLEWGFALEYSLIYLESQVKDLHLHAPFDRMIPLVEFALETPLNRGQGGQTTGTVNPGVLWAGQHCQFGVEAIVPVNQRTGNNVGVIAQMHFYLDDIFPHSFGRPLFGGTK